MKCLSNFSGKFYVENPNTLKLKKICSGFFWVWVGDGVKWGKSQSKPKYFNLEMLTWCLMRIAVQVPHTPILLCGLGSPAGVSPMMHHDDSATGVTVLYRGRGSLAKGSSV